MLIGVTVGAIMSLLMVILASCILFLWCPGFLRKENIKQKSKQGEQCRGDTDLTRLVFHLTKQGC